MSYFGFGDQKPTSPGSQNNTARSLFVSEGSTVAESEENQSLVDKGRGFFNSVGDRLKGGVDSVRNAAEEATVTRDRLIIAVVAMLVGVLFFFLSLTLLPTIVLAPQKFALMFTSGSICFMFAFSTMRGHSAFLAHVFSRDRLWFTIAYISSLVLTLYGCLIAKSYFLALIFAIVQMITLSYFTLSYIPGGVAALNFIGGFIGSGLKKLLPESLRPAEAQPQASAACAQVIAVFMVAVSDEQFKLAYDGMYATSNRSGEYIKRLKSMKVSKGKAAPEDDVKIGYRSEDFAVFNLGVRLYFGVIKKLAFFFFLMGIVTLPNLIFNICGSMLSDSEAAFGYERSMLVNLGDSPSGEAISQYGERLATINRSVTCGGVYDIKDIVIVQSSLDLVAMIIFIVGCSYMLWSWIPRAAKDFDNNTTSLGDFSLWVTGLPTHINGKGADTIENEREYKIKVAEHFKMVWDTYATTADKQDLEEELAEAADVKKLTLENLVKSHDEALVLKQQGLDTPQLEQKKKKEKHSSGPDVNLESIAYGLKESRETFLGDFVQEIVLVTHMHGLYRMFDDEIKATHNIDSVQARGNDTKKAIQQRQDILDDITAKTKNKSINSDVLGAFVVFESTVVQEFMTKIYGSSNTWLGRMSQPPTLRFHSMNKIKVREATEPTSINWDNMDYSHQRRNRKVVLTYTLSLVLLVISAAIAAGLQHASNLLSDPKKSYVCDLMFSDGPTNEAVGECYNAISKSSSFSSQVSQAFSDMSFCYCSVNASQGYSLYSTICEDYTWDSNLVLFVGVMASAIIAIINFALKTVLVIFVDWENYTSTSAEQRSLANRLFVAQVFNTVLVTVIVNAWWGPNVTMGQYEDFNKMWYVKVGGSILLTLILNILILPGTMTIGWLLNKAFRLLKAAPVGSFRDRRLAKFVGGRAATPHEVKKLFELPNFELSIRFAPVINAVLSALIMSSGMPVMNFICCATMILLFFIDRFVLIKMSTSYTFYDASIAKASASIMQRLGPILHIAFALWMFGHPVISPSDPISDAVKYAMNHTDNGYDDFAANLKKKINDAEAVVENSVLTAAESRDAIQSISVCNGFMGTQATTIYNMHTSNDDFFDDFIPAYTTDRTLAYCDARSFEMHLKVIDQLGNKIETFTDGYGSIETGYDIWARAFQRATVAPSVLLCLVGAFLVYKYVMRVIALPIIYLTQCISKHRKAKKMMKKLEQEKNESDRVDEDPTLTYSLALIQGTIPTHLGFSYQMKFARSKYREMYDRFMRMRADEGMEDAKLYLKSIRGSDEDNFHTTAVELSKDEDGGNQQKANEILAVDGSAELQDQANAVVQHSSLLRKGEIPEECWQYARDLLAKINGNSNDAFIPPPRRNRDSNGEYFGVASTNVREYEAPAPSTLVIASSDAADLHLQDSVPSSQHRNQEQQPFVSAVEEDDIWASANGLRVSGTEENDISPVGYYTDSSPAIGQNTHAAPNYSDEFDEAADSLRIQSSSDPTLFAVPDEVDSEVYSGKYKLKGT